MRKLLNIMLFGLVFAIAFVSIPTAIVMGFVGELKLLAVAVIVGLLFTALSNKLFVTLNF